MARRKNETLVTTMRLPAGLLKDLDRLADREGRSRSSLVVHVLRDHVRRHVRRPPREESGDVLD